MSDPIYPVIHPKRFSMDIDANYSAGFKADDGDTLFNGDSVTISSDGDQVTLKAAYEWGPVGVNTMKINSDGLVSISGFFGMLKQTGDSACVRRDAIGVLKTARQDLPNGSTLAGKLSEVVRRFEGFNKGK